MKTIGIKLADGSFYPVLEEDNPTVKTLELTTAHNNQTKVMVDLYRSKECSMEDAEYVDSLQIENLIAHPNGEPSISFNVSIDENNELQAKIEDPETGKQSGTTITLVSRTLEERLTTDEYNINDITLDEDSFNNLENENKEEDNDTAKKVAKAAVGGGLLMAAGALIAKDNEKEKEETEPKVIDEPVVDMDSENIIEESDLSLENDNEEVNIDEELPNIDDLNINEEPVIEDEKKEEDSLADFGNFDDILNDNDSSEKENVEEENFDLPIEEEEKNDEINLDDLTSSNMDELSTEGLDDIGSFDNSEVEENDNSELDINNLPDFDDEPKKDETVIEDELPDFDNLSLDSTEEVNEDNDIASISDFDLDSPITENEEIKEEDSEFSLDNEELPENATVENDNDLEDIISSPDIDDILAENKEENDDTVIEDDFATDSITEEEAFDLPDDLDQTKTGEDIASDDKFFGNNFGGFGDEQSDELPNFDDIEEDKTVESDDNNDLDLSSMPDFDETIEDNNDSPNFDNLDLEDDKTVINEEPVGLDLSDIPDFDEDESDNSDGPNFDDDFFDTDTFNETNNASSGGNGGLSFTGLYDKETEMGKPGEQSDEVEKKTKTPVIICVICAVICIIATLLILFIIPSKYNLINKETTKEEVSVTVPDVPVVEEEIEEEVIPEAKEDEIVIVEKAEEVIPTQPELPEVKPLDTDYKIIWGDTLWDIADSYYKNPWKYKDIAHHNDISNPDHIISGTHITIPAE